MKIGDCHRTRIGYWMRRAEYAGLRLTTCDLCKKWHVITAQDGHGETCRCGAVRVRMTIRDGMLTIEPRKHARCLPPPAKRLLTECQGATPAVYVAWHRCPSRGRGSLDSSQVWGGLWPAEGQTCNIGDVYQL